MKLTELCASRSVKMTVASVVVIPINTLAACSVTMAVPGALKRRVNGYIKGIIAQLLNKHISLIIVQNKS